MSTPDLGHTGGARTALPAFATHTVTRTLPSLSGTGKSMYMENCVPTLISYGANLLLFLCSPFLKERLFGLSNPQGNHGESIKEAHFHLDNTPVSSDCCHPFYTYALTI